MKKNFLTYTILLSGLLFVSCASSKENVTSNSYTSSSSEAQSKQLKEYKDNTISCLYDPSILKIQESSPNGNLTYGITFYDDINNITDDISNGTCLYVATQSHTMSYNNTNRWMLPAMTEMLFNSLFNIETNDSTNIEELDNNIYEYTSKINDIEYYAKLFYIDNSEMTISVCRILPDETEEYKEALKSCYESISYIKEKDSLEETKKKTEKDSENYKEITSGNLYNSIKKIHSNLNYLIKLENSYSVSLISDNPTQFFSSCEKIFKKVFKKNTSVTFDMCPNKDNYDSTATLTVVKNDNSDVYKLHASLLVFDKTKKKKINSAYSKNKFWQSIDLDNLSDKAFQEITDNYE